MAARTATNKPQGDGNESDTRFGFIRAALNGPARLAGLPLRVLSFRPPSPSLKLSRPSARFGLKRPSAFAVAALAVATAVLFVGLLTYYGAQEFSGRAADTRASNEAMSFAEHSSRLATGDAFDGYIQILRYADDPIINAKVSSANDRGSALQRLLYLNINKFLSLTIADRSGLILATTDSTLTSVKGGTTFSETRANLAPANSDIVLPEAGHHGYVEYSAPLRDPDGTVWGILVGRADPAILWKGTLAASVDGGRNVIINNEGLFAAGVPDDLLRQPWHGRPLSNGGVRADIAGTDSICGLAPIGRDTQIDRGLNVASCLPASLIQVERHTATDKQGLITLAGVVLAIVVASVLLRLFIRGGGPVAAVAAAPATSAGNAVPALDDLFGASGEEDADRDDVDLEPDLKEDPREVAAEIDVIETATEEFAAECMDISEIDDDIATIDDRMEPDAEPLLPPPPPDVDALTLISAYEERNARLALRLRETVQAKMLVAATEADAAFKLIETDAETAGAMHGHAMEELEHIRLHELRSIGQEIFPGLTRLGLPGALRAMRKEFGGSMGIELDVDATTDSVAGGASRSSVAPALRLVMYRFALESVRALSAAGADACAIALRREGTQLMLAISCGGIRAASFDRDVLAPSELAAEAYAGSVEVEAADDGLVITLAVPAPTAEADPVVDLEKAFASFEAEDDAEDAEQTSVYAVVSADIDDTDDDDDEETGAPTAITPDASGVVLPPRTGLAASVEALQAEFFGSMIVALDMAADLDDGTAAVVDESRVAIEDVVRESLRALQAADARQCDLTLTRAGSQIMLSILSAVGDADFDEGLILAHQGTLDRLQGYLAVDRREGNVAISAEVSALGADTQSAAEPAPSDEDGAQHAA